MIPKVSKILLFLIISCLTLKNGFSQENRKGYWDNLRAFKQKFDMSAGERRTVAVKIPLGTTQIIYRVIVTDNGQEVPKSLYSVISKVDPTSLMSTGVSLLSNIAGNSKCYYSIFNSIAQANNFVKSGIDFAKPCYRNNLKINEDSKVLELGDNCLKNASILYFGFKSTNMIETENISLEVIPWIDNKLATGWNAGTKEEFISNCKTTYEKIPNNEEFCLCILDKIAEQHTVDEYNRLIPAERIKFIKSNESICNVTSGASEIINEQIQGEADDYFDKGDYKNAIIKYLELVENNSADEIDYQYLAESYLLTKQFTKALKYIKIAEQIDTDDLSIKLDLAHLYLLTDNLAEAKKIYLKYKNENVNDTTSWKEQIQEDFKLFTENKIKSDYFNQILSLLK
jgi:tetratricopeptide (TPR) repeat protein